MHPIFIPDDEEEDGESAQEIGTFHNNVNFLRMHLSSFSYGIH